MGHPCLIAFVLTSIHLPTALSITSASAPRNFRRHIGAPAPPIDWDRDRDWENGLRAAIYQMLIRQGYSHPNLREYLSIAPVLGQRSTVTATPFGDIAVLARGQLYLINTGFAFIQDPNSYDCDECNEQQICGATNCRWSKPQPYGTLLALWTARRIRHRDRNYGHRYEVQYTISPISSDSSGAFILKNGLFNYDIAGQVFASTQPMDYHHASEQQHSCKQCNHHHDNYNYVPAILTQQSRGYLPPPMTVMEVKPARSKGGFLLGMNPNDGKYALQSLPEQEEAHGYHKHDLQKEIELYTRLLQSLATQRPQTEPTTPSPGTTKFIPSTMPVFMTASIKKQKTTLPSQTTTFMDFVKMSRTAAVQLRPIHQKTTPTASSPYNKTTHYQPTMASLTTPFKASPNYVRYSEPDPLYPPAPMMYYTTAAKKSSQFFSSTTSRKKTTSATEPTTKQKQQHKVYDVNAPTTRSPLITPLTFKTTKINDFHYQRSTSDEQSQENESTESTTKQKQHKVYDVNAPTTRSPLATTPTFKTTQTNQRSKSNKQSQENESNETLKATMIPYYEQQQTSVTSTATENKTTALNYEVVTKSTEQDQETTTVLTESVPTTERASIKQETYQPKLSTTNEDETSTEVIIIQTQGTLTSIPYTTMNADDKSVTEEDDNENVNTSTTEEASEALSTNNKLVTEEDDNKNVNTLTTVAFFNVEEANEDFSTNNKLVTEEDDNNNVNTPATVGFFNVEEASDGLSTEPSTPQQTTEYTTTTPQKETTDLPPINLYDVESTTAEAQTESTFYISEIPANTETLRTITDATITKTETEISLLDEIFGTVITDRALKSSTKSTTKLKNTKEIDEVFDGEILAEGDSDSTQRNVRIIFSNFYSAGPPSEITTRLDSHSESETQGYHSEYTTETDYTTETQPVTVIPTSQSYSTSITFEVNKRNKSSSLEPNEKVKAKLMEIKLNDTEFMIYKAELPEKRPEMSASNTFDSIALMLVNHAKSIDYVHKKRNETKPKRKHRKSKQHQKTIL